MIPLRKEAGELARKIFDGDFDFDELALRVFLFQYRNVDIYKRYVDTLKVNPGEVNEVSKIPFLPVRFFKNYKVAIPEFETPVVFSSSGTTGSQTAMHYVADATLYEKSIIKCFEPVFGSPQEWCFLALLPSYLERHDSSLVYMCRFLMEQSTNAANGFYLNNHQDLNMKLKELQMQNVKTILIGVTYALLDFAQHFAQPLHNIIIMETGGMKGKRREMVRDEVHLILKKAFGIEKVFSEYGMTEMLSQCYSTGDGKFTTPAHVKILLRDTYDPLTVGNGITRGGICVVDLANIYSCSFIGTQDIGRMLGDNTFEVLGRFDDSDIRGCNLMVE